MKRLASLVVAGLAFGSATISNGAAYAEEVVAGLKLGITQAEALTSLGNSASIARVSGSWGDQIIWTSRISAQLCNGRVVAISEALPGGVHEFARLTKDETAVRGSALLNPLNGLSSQGEHSTLAAEWAVAGGVYRLTLSADTNGHLSLSRQIHWNRICGASPKK
jgi:hypothetical protein